MSRVYRAEQTALQRRVALKVLSAHLAEDADYRDRFLRESRLAAAIEHPNILPIYDAGEANGYLYIAMRLVDGADLRSILQREGALGVPMALAVLKQTAQALDAAHAVGLVHRDVKPANLLLAGEHLYLTDFGVAKVGESSSSLTRVGVFVGTIDYAAPEQIRNEPIDGRADIYALGCVFYECLTGHTPFDHPTDHAVLQSHLTELVPSVRETRPELPASIDAVLDTAMAKDPHARYRSAALFAEAARLALEGRVGTARATVIEPVNLGTVPWPASNPKSPATISSGSPTARPTRPGVNRRRILGGVLGLLMLGGGLAAASRLSSPTGTVASPSVSGQAATTTAPPTFVPPTTPPPTPPPPYAGRPVTLKPQDMIMPPGEFPFRGYSINEDDGFALFGTAYWTRQFSSTTLDYYHIEITLTVYGPSTSGTSQLARATCDITFVNPPAPTVSEVTAEVIADGAKACQYHFEGNISDWVQYQTATRNVLISVAGEPRLLSISNTAAMTQMIALARQQIAIIDRVAPR